MTSWAEFEAAAPEVAGEGRRLLYAGGHGQGLLATVRGDDPPRIHPVSLGVVDGHLYVFLLKSAKRVDLERDGRYALHAHQDPLNPAEFAVRGRARQVEDAAVIKAIGDGWSFEVDDTYHLFDFSVEWAVLGVRGADEWPPRYTTWSANDAAGATGRTG